jgi:ribosome biogenesis GTPase A
MPELERQVAWYPGHMAKAARRIRELLQTIDVVIEVVDARVARCGRNPLLDELASRRTRVLAFTRADLADGSVTKRWLATVREGCVEAIAVDARHGRSVARVVTAIAGASKIAGRAGISRAMIVGVPNSGKSTIVNALLGRASAKTESRAGVTRQTQWFRLAPGIEVMDTPGVLPPKIEGAASQWKLALCGAVPRDLYDPQEIAALFHQWLIGHHPRTHVPDLAAFAARRGFVRRGGEIDYHTAAHSYIRAFNEGTFGRISLEAPGDAEAA